MIYVHMLALFTATFAFDGLINPQATAEAKELYTRMVADYGRRVWSGQTSFHYDDVVNKVGRQPLVQGFDMQNYSPHNPWFNWEPYDDGTVSRAIEWYGSNEGKGVVSFHWHWFSPMGGQLRTSTFYTNNTDFNLTKAVSQGSEEYNATVRDIDAIAVQLLKLQAQGIPIIWRPLHEAGGGWFWWGSSTHVATLQLYYLMYDRLTNYHHLNNLIWEWSTPQPEWYPGNSRVDMIGYDSYPGPFVYECRTQIFMELKGLVGGRKMVHLSENGPIPEFASCFHEGSTWGYFLSWSDLVFSQNSDSHLQEIYHHHLVLTLPLLS
jgi:mannan endo-1,4-beta-mannosidase